MGNFQSENPLGKQEIGDKIFDVVKDLHPEQAEAITGMLMELKEAELRRLLTEEAELHHKIWTAMRALEADEKHDQPSSSERKLILGEQVFSELEKIMPIHADKITGMLVEMSVEDLEHILKDRHTMLNKAQDAVRVLIDSKLIDEQQLEQEKQDMGDEIFNLVKGQFPDNADRITGMILEMDYFTLQHIVFNRQILQEKIQVAASALIKENCNQNDLIH